MELSKLLKPKKKNNAYALRPFITDLLENKIYATTSLKKESLENWLAELDSSNGVIDNILAQRDKLYAHTDVDVTDFEFRVTYDDTHKMLLFIAGIIEELHDSILEGGILPKLINEPVENLKFIIKKLGEWHQSMEKLIEGQ